MTQLLPFVKDYCENVPARAELALSSILCAVPFEYPLSDLIANMGSYLTNTDNVLRGRAINVLTCIFVNLLATSNISQAVAKPEDLKVLVSFFCDKIADVHCLRSALKACHALLQIAEHMPGAYPEAAVDVCKSIFKEVNVQASEQSTRQCVYLLLLYITQSKVHGSALLGKLASGSHSNGFATSGEPYILDFATGFINAMDGEKDPRCLPACLKIAATLLSCRPPFEYGLHIEPLIGELFDVTSCYFPITFTPPRNDPHGITKEMLTTGLREVLCASPHIASLIIPLLLEKLSSSLPDAKRESLRTLALCAAVFGPDVFQKYLLEIASQLRTEIIHVIDRDFPGGGAGLFGISSIWTTGKGDMTPAALLTQLSGPKSGTLNCPSGNDSECDSIRASVFEQSLLSSENIGISAVNIGPEFSGTAENQTTSGFTLFSTPMPISSHPCNLTNRTPSSAILRTPPSPFKEKNAYCDLPESLAIQRRAYLSDTVLLKGLTGLGVGRTTSECFCDILPIHYRNLRGIWMGPPLPIVEEVLRCIYALSVVFLPTRSDDSQQIEAVVEDDLDLIDFLEDGTDTTKVVTNTTHSRRKDPIWQEWFRMIVRPSLVDIERTPESLAGRSSVRVLCAIAATSPWALHDILTWSMTSIRNLYRDARQNAMYGVLTSVVAMVSGLLHTLDPFLDFPVKSHPLAPFVNEIFDILVGSAFYAGSTPQLDVICTGGGLCESNPTNLEEKASNAHSTDSAPFRAKTRSCGERDGGEHNDAEGSACCGRHDHSDGSKAPRHSDGCCSSTSHEGLSESSSLPMVTEIRAIALAGLCDLLSRPPTPLVPPEVRYLLIHRITLLHLFDKDSLIQKAALRVTITFAAVRNKLLDIVASVSIPILLNLIKISSGLPLDVEWSWLTSKDFLTSSYPFDLINYSCPMSQSVFSASGPWNTLFDEYKKSTMHLVVPHSIGQGNILSCDTAQPSSLPCVTLLNSTQSPVGDHFTLVTRSLQSLYQLASCPSESIAFMIFPVLMDIVMKRNSRIVHENGKEDIEADPYASSVLTWRTGGPGGAITRTLVLKTISEIVQIKSILHVYKTQLRPSLSPSVIISSGNTSHHGHENKLDSSIDWMVRNTPSTLQAWAYRREREAFLLGLIFGNEPIREVVLDKDQDICDIIKKHPPPPVLLPSLLSLVFDSLNEDRNRELGYEEAYCRASNVDVTVQKASATKSGSDSDSDRRSTRTTTSQASHYRCSFLPPIILNACESIFRSIAVSSSPETYNTLQSYVCDILLQNVDKANFVEGSEEEKSVSPQASHTQQSNCAGGNKTSHCIKEHRDPLCVKWLKFFLPPAPVFITSKSISSTVYASILALLLALIYRTDTTSPLPSHLSAVLLELLSLSYQQQLHYGESAKIRSLERRDHLDMNDNLLRNDQPETVSIDTDRISPSSNGRSSALVHDVWSDCDDPLVEGLSTFITKGTTSSQTLQIHQTSLFPAADNQPSEQIGPHPFYYLNTTKDTPNEVFLCSGTGAAFFVPFRRSYVFRRSCIIVAKSIALLLYRAINAVHATDTKAKRAVLGAKNSDETKTQLTQVIEKIGIFIALKTGVGARQWLVSEDQMASSLTQGFSASSNTHYEVIRVGIVSSVWIAKALALSGHPLLSKFLDALIDIVHADYLQAINSESPAAALQQMAIGTKYPSSLIALSASGLATVVDSCSSKYFSGPNRQPRNADYKRSVFDVVNNRYLEQRQQLRALSLEGRTNLICSLPMLLALCSVARYLKPQSLLRLSDSLVPVFVSTIHALPQFSPLLSGMKIPTTPVEARRMSAKYLQLTSINEAMRDGDSNDPLYCPSSLLDSVATSVLYSLRTLMNYEDGMVKLSAHFGNLVPSLVKLSLFVKPCIRRAHTSQSKFVDNREQLEDSWRGGRPIVRAEAIDCLRMISAAASSSQRTTIKQNISTDNELNMKETTSGCISFHQLYQVKDFVICGLIYALDDPKRGVRRRAAACRNDWMTLSS